MVRILSILLIFISAVHGLIHLMGFSAYWPLTKIDQLPYKTELLGGALNLSANGMRLFSVFWLIAALGFLTAAAALAFKQPVWAWLMLGSAVLSAALCVLDWEMAFRGFWINLVLLLALGVVFGFRVKPAPFPTFNLPAGQTQSTPLPAGLPAPVERFYRQTYGEQIPVYQSGVFSGRGTIRFMGVVMPARLRFSHIAGQSYRHYIEATFYGHPIFKVNERFIDGVSRLELPFGAVVDNDPITNSAANQGLWAESLSYPALFLTDPRVRWEAVDDATARLRVPFEPEGGQEFIVKFDPQSGELTHMETLRYRDASTGKLRWWGDVTHPADRSGSTRLAVTWEDEGSPWLVYELEEIVFNADLSSYILQKGY